MNKTFSKESDGEEDLSSLPVGGKNYIRPEGYARLRAELLDLIDVARPEVVKVVHWAASNGDRSENGDYIYGKRRLREIDRRIRFLTKRLDLAEVIDPGGHHGNEQIFFGATVTYCDQNGAEHTVTIVGIDEIDPLKGLISWISPMARSLIKARTGEVVTLLSPGGLQELEILEVSYPKPT